MLDSSGLVVDSGPFSGLSIPSARTRIIEALRDKGLGDAAVEYRLRDWCISRQRYWETPIPIVYCDACGTVPLPPEELPLMLPLDIKPTFAGNPLADAQSFVRCRCPRCQRAARRETDTMDTYCDSSWYIFRCLTPDLEDDAFDPRDAARWLPADVGVGGVDAIWACSYQQLDSDLGIGLTAGPTSEPTPRRSVGKLAFARSRLCWTC